MKAQVPSNEILRLESLIRHKILDTSRESAYDDITRLAAFICNTPMAAVSLVDEKRQWFKSAVGLEVLETPREVAFCAHTILSPKMLIVEDASVDVRFFDNPLVVNEPKVRFYAGVPLIASDGCAIGSLCVLDTVCRTLTDEQAMALGVLAGQVSGQLELSYQAIVLGDLAKEREDALVALSSERTQFHYLVESLGTGVFMTDTDDLVIYANPKMAELTGYTTEEMIGWRNLDSILSSTELLAVRNSRHSNLSSASYELEITNGQGELRWLDVKTVVYDHAGSKFVGYLTTCTDITDRVHAETAYRESERRFRLALTAATFGWWHLDISTFCYKEFSIECLGQFGLPKDFEFSFDYFKRSIHQDDKERVDRAIEAAIVDRSKFICEFRIVWPDGSVHWLSSYGVPVSPDVMHPLEYSGISKDITEQKELEEGREKLLRIAQNRADRDPLTQLLNHRAFQKSFELEADRAMRDGTTLAVIILDVDYFKFFNDVYGHAIGDEVLCNITDKLLSGCSRHDILARYGGDEFVMLLPNIGSAQRSEIEARVLSAIGTLSYQPAGQVSSIPITMSIGSALFPFENQDRHETLRRAGERMLVFKSRGLIESLADNTREEIRMSVGGFSMLDALVTAVDNKDRYTRKHSEDVLTYCLMIAGEMGLGQEAIQSISTAALLHDLGKIGVPDAILRKPGKLTEGEYEAIKQHPVMGAAIVTTVPGLEHTLDAIRHHHERWDGGGYPYGLLKEETPFTARLMAVADAYSAMTTDRPYRKGMKSAEAQMILRKGSGTQWDPACVDAFLRAIKGKAVAA